MECFAKIVNGFRPLTIFTKCSIEFDRVLNTPIENLLCFATPQPPLLTPFLKILKGTAFKMQLKNQDIASFLGILLMQVVSFEKAFINNRDHSFSTNAKFSEKLIFLTL